MGKWTSKKKISKRRFNRRNRRYRNRNRNRPSTITVRTPSSIPDRVFVKLKYSHLGYPIMQNGPQFITTFRGNGAHDPDQGLGGHSPYSWNQWSLLFENYRVHKSTIFVRLARTTEPMKFAVTPSTDPSKPANMQIAFETPYTRRRTITSSIQPNAQVFNSMFTKKIYGVKSITQEDDFTANTVGTTSQNPNKEWFWVINSVSYDGITNNTAHADISLVYYIEFFNRYEQSLSGVGEEAPDGATGHFVNWETEFPAPVGTGSTGY